MWKQRLNAMLLVGGTAIGGGMLALPVGAGVGGFLPSLFWLLFSWALMTASSLLLVEANLWMKEGAHVISMSKRFLGPLGQALSWILYLYISYASLVSYAAGGGDLVSCSFVRLSDTCLARADAILLFTLFLTLIVYFGARFVGTINSLFFTAMVVAYLLLLAIGLDDLNPMLLTKKHWFASTFALPLLLTSFSHQTMVPSLTPLLNRNSNDLKFAIIGGTTIAFLLYTFWLALIFGIIPVGGENGLIKAFIEGSPATSFFNDHVTGFWLVPLMNFFSFFAIVTSFLGMGLGLFDFLSDGLGIPEKGVGKLSLWLLIVVPVVFFAVYFERAFLVAMETTGGVGDSILNGLLPIAMVWIGRYKLNLTSQLRLFGGKPLLLLLALAFFAILVWEIVMLSTNLVLNTLTSA